MTNVGASSSGTAAAGKGKGISRASTITIGAATKTARTQSTKTNTGVEVVCEDGKVVKLKGPTQYVWSHGEKYGNGFTCYYCETSIAGGGATRFRQHLGGVSGNVTTCDKVPPYISKLMADEVVKRTIRNKKNKDLQFYVQRELIEASKNYGMHGSTTIPPTEEAQIQMAMRESLREHALQHGSPMSIGNTSGSGAASCSANRQTTINRFYQSSPSSSKAPFDMDLARSRTQVQPRVDIMLTEGARDKLGKKGKLFGGEAARRSAVNGRVSPADWWVQYGGDYPDLQYFAKRIVSQCMSSSGCERNWSTFALIHTKLRNRLSYDKLHKLVYVHYNLKLRIQQFESEMQSLQDMQSHHELDADPCSILMDCAMYDENNPIMDWLCNSRSESAPTLDEDVDSEPGEPNNPSEFVVEELGMDEDEVAAFKEDIFGKKSGKKRKQPSEKEDSANDSESDSMQRSPPYAESGDSSSDDGGDGEFDV
ncbi:hypothetical protein HU200_066125 [Digitaria exilis]|uniref:HAT C-terminal dimerisation domain-containing protein n=1 Tax=Digitaria exilis TaxID=1010633 RepID=A0A834ZYU9_9POAL|nr:hypothetical protein HU200_066125 [Digitaria exilis]